MRNLLFSKTYLLFAVIFLANYYNIFGQTESRQGGEVPESDSARAEYYFKRFVYFMDEDYNLDSAKVQAALAYEYAENSQDSLTLSRAANGLGFILEKQGLYRLSQFYYRQALEISKNHADDPEYSDRIKTIYNGLGNAYYHDGIYEEALNAHIESIKLREYERDQGLNQASLGTAYTNIGLVYYKLNELDKALEYQHRAIREFRKEGENKFAENYINLGLIFNQKANFNNRYPEFSQSLYFDSAKYYFRLAIDRCTYFEECSNDVQFEMYNGLGLAHHHEGNIDSSIFYNVQAAKIKPSLPNKIIVLHNRAYIELQRKNLDVAFELVKEAQNLIDSGKIMSIKPINLQLLGEISARKGDYKSAYKYLNQYDSVKDDIFNEKVLSRVRAFELDNAQSENYAIISKQEEKIENFRSVIFLSGVIILLLGFMGAILYRNNVQRKKANQKLFDANKIIEDQNQQLKNMNVVLEEKVRERTKELRTANMALKQSNMELDNFIYKTSHDIRGPLATLQGICNVALMDVQDTKAIDYLQKLGKTANRLNEILSKLLVINQINNSEIAQEEIDFEMIVDHVIQENRKINAADIAVIKELTPSLIFQSDHNLVKIIISNLVNNAFKYYNPSSRVESFIRLRIDNDRINLNISVIDNGMGIDDKVGDKIFEIFSKASEMSDSAGLGLYLVKLAVEKLNGKILLKRTREGYTEFKVKIPIN